MTITQWQVPLLVMAVIIVAELGFERLRRSKSVRTQLKFRTGGLGVLAALVSVIGIIALGPSLADQLASVAAAIAGIAALWLTYQSYRSLQSTVARDAAAPTEAPTGVVVLPQVEAPPPVPPSSPVASSPVMSSAVRPTTRGATETTLTKPRRSRWRRRADG